MNSKKLYWKDFVVGERKEIGSKLFKKEEIIKFAEKFDPQYFHIDEKKAKLSVFKGLVACGWHTCSEVMRLICDSYLLKTESLGSPGVNNLQWKHPVRPEDKITVFRTISSKRISKSNKDVGIIIIIFEAYNQSNTLVLSMEVCQMVRNQ
ncbi:MAG: MaoC family dehydratase [Pseudomonadota bacterium]|nr:MaoC family dehydratase [Pseudomonadota bacterium]